MILESIIVLRIISMSMIAMCADRCITVIFVLVVVMITYICNIDVYDSYACDICFYDSYIYLITAN